MWKCPIWEVSIMTPLCLSLFPLSLLPPPPVPLSHSSCSLSLSLSFIALHLLLLPPPPPSVPSSLSASLPTTRPDRVPWDDGGGLRVGRNGRPDWPAADPAHLPVHQQRGRLLLVLRPGLQHVPALSHGLRLWVRRLFYPALCTSLLDYTVLYSTTLHWSLLYCILHCCITHYSAVLYTTVIYATLLY